MMMMSLGHLGDTSLVPTASHKAGVTSRAFLGIPVALKIENMDFGPANIAVRRKTDYRCDYRILGDRYVEWFTYTGPTCLPIWFSMLPLQFAWLVILISSCTRSLPPKGSYGAR